MSEENLEPGLGADNPDNSCAPETKAGNEPQSLWGELSDEQKSFLSKKGLKNPADAVKSYMELEKQTGGKFSIPEDGDAEALAKIYKKLGRPDDAAGYDLKDIADIDKPKIDDFKAACLENNLLPARPQGFMPGIRRTKTGWLRSLTSWQPGKLKKSGKNGEPILTKTARL